MPSHLEPLRVRPERRLPADWSLPGQRPAQLARCPAVGNTLMSVPISATMTSAVRWATPVIVLASCTPPAPGGPNWSSIASESRSICSSRKSRCARIAPITSAWWASKRPSSACLSAGSLARSLPLANSASTSGSVVPATSASSIARPDAPRMSVATQSSLMPVSSKALCSRLASRWRSAICVMRYLVRVRSRRWGLAGRSWPEQAGLPQLTQPLRVGDVGLAAGHVLDVPRVAQRQLEVVLEHVPDRLPVDAGGLHRHMRDAVRGQPVTQRDQTLHGRRELGHMRLAAPGPVRDPNAPRHLRLMDIKRADALEDRLHQPSRIEHLTAPPGGAFETDESDGRARSNSPGSRGRPPHQTSDGRTGTKGETASTGDPHIITHFTRPRMPQGQDN